MAATTAAAEEAARKAAPAAAGKAGAEAAAAQPAGEEAAGGKEKPKKAKTPREKDPIKELAADAKKRISMYSTTMSDVMTILSGMESDKSWQWALKDDDGVALKKQHRLLQEHVHTKENLSRILTNDLGKLRKELGDGPFSAALQDAINLEPKLHKIAGLVTCLLQVHKCKLDAKAQKSQKSGRAA